jgi:hypothetical protein
MVEAIARVAERSTMVDSDALLRKRAKVIARKRLKDAKKVLDTESEKQRAYEGLLIAYDADVEEYIRTDFENRYKQDPACEMSLLFKGFLFGPSSLTEEERSEWERQMMVFEEVFDEEYNSPG